MKQGFKFPKVRHAVRRKPGIFLFCYRVVKDSKMEVSKCCQPNWRMDCLHGGGFPLLASSRRVRRRTVCGSQPRQASCAEMVAIPYTVAIEPNFRLFFFQFNWLPVPGFQARTRQLLRSSIQPPCPPLAEISSDGTCNSPPLETRLPGPMAGGES